MINLGWLFFIFQLLDFQSDVVLTVQIESGENGGNVMIGVFSNRDDFLELPIQHAYVSLSEAIDGVSFKLKPGNYALSAYQDFNDNRELDTNLIGIPKEPYGFSNNVRGNFGPASFEECTVEMQSDKSIKIKVY